LGMRTLQAKRYAQAIFKIAQEHNSFGNWRLDLEKIAALSQDKELVSFIENPKFPFEKKLSLVSPVLQNLSLLASNLVQLLINQNKLRLLQDIYLEYQDLLNEHLGIQKAEVTTAMPLEESEKLKIQKDLETISDKKVILSLKVDPAIVGGLIIEIGGKWIDGSTRSRLNALKNEMIRAKT
jgi:F-type H+-transporting ATPase subunit delta